MAVVEPGPRASCVRLQAVADYMRKTLMVTATPVRSIVRRFGRYGEGNIAWYGRCTD